MIVLAAAFLISIFSHLPISFISVACIVINLYDKNFSFSKQQIMVENCYSTFFKLLVFKNLMLHLEMNARQLLFPFFSSPEHAIKSLMSLIINIKRLSQAIRDQDSNSYSLPNRSYIDYVIGKLPNLLVGFLMFLLIDI